MCCSRKLCSYFAFVLQASSWNERWRCWSSLTEEVSKLVSSISHWLTAFYLHKCLAPKLSLDWLLSLESREGSSFLQVPTQFSRASSLLKRHVSGLNGLVTALESDWLSRGLAVRLKMSILYSATVSLTREPSRIDSISSNVYSCCVSVQTLVQNYSLTIV